MTVSWFTRVPALRLPGRRDAARYDVAVEVTSSFERNVMLDNPDRAGISKGMCEVVVAAPEHSERQPDGRLRFWGRGGRRTCS